MKTSVRASRLVESSVSSDNSFSETDFNKYYETGWAQPKRHRPSFTKEQKKNFVEAAFNRGEATNVKKTPEAIIEHFKPKDVVTARQIKVLIQSLSVQPKQKKRKLNDDENDDENDD